jgi:hypothetical protein
VCAQHFVRSLRHGAGGLADAEQEYWCRNRMLLEVCAHALAAMDSRNRRLANAEKDLARIVRHKRINSLLYTRRG